MHAQEAMCSGKAVTDKIDKTLTFTELQFLGEEKEAVHKRRKKDIRKLQ
jgi:hypothetical protein